MSAFSKRKIEYLIQLNPRKSVKLLLHFKVLHRVHDFEFLSSNVVTHYILTKDFVSDGKYGFLIQLSYFHFDFHIYELCYSFYWSFIIKTSVAQNSTSFFNPICSLDDFRAFAAWPLTNLPVGIID